ncbi:hypothetical protein GCM10010425_50260 [Streptomyces spororaveus]|uniref:HTH marR-type domain-containing protein n=1 Tax=Streptomyces spororaveus TaxID=284039 RepID=A0ABQ3T2K2_9ACTN|nr:hypothetical protein [Streptomyces spororaveus]GHI74620.1 hypothetical protein Sspor_01810 [Streptomyces spororaveus]
MSPHRAHAGTPAFDVLTARKGPGACSASDSRTSPNASGRTQSVVSRAIGQLRDKGILSERQRKGTVLIHPLQAGYESSTTGSTTSRTPRPSCGR